MLFMYLGRKSARKKSGRPPGPRRVLQWTTATGPPPKASQTQGTYRMDIHSTTAGTAVGITGSIAMPICET